MFARSWWIGCVFTLLCNQEKSNFARANDVRDGGCPLYPQPEVLNECLTFASPEELRLSLSKASGLTVLCESDSLESDTVIKLKDKVHLVCQTPGMCKFNMGGSLESIFRIQDTDAEVTMQGLVFSGASVTAVRVFDAPKHQKICDCEFIGNKNPEGKGRGLGLRADENTHVTVGYSKFTLNEGLEGSAIFSEGTLGVFQTSFIDNISYNGAVYSTTTGTLFMSNSRFIGNHARGRGPAIFAEEGPSGVEIDSVIGTNNTADLKKGKCNGVFFANKSTRARDCVPFEPSNETGIQETDQPSALPSSHPSLAPTAMPSNTPTIFPSSLPSKVSSMMPTVAETMEPSSIPSAHPSSPLTDPPSSNIQPESDLCAMSQVERETQILSALGQLTPIEILEDTFTPQGRAANFLIYHDGRFLCPDDKTLAQRYALVTLYYATNEGDDAWFNCYEGDTLVDLCSQYFEGLHGSDFGGTPWLSSDDECNWAGIACDLSQVPKVKEIRVSHNGLYGIIPYEIGDHIIPSLQVLDMEENFLFGPIPPVFGEGLLRLKLNKNMLWGPVPTNLPSSLISLSLNDNDLSGDTSFLAPLLNIRQIYFRFNDITGAVPDSFCDVREMPRPLKITVDCEKVWCKCCVPFCNNIFN